MRDMMGLMPATAAGSMRALAGKQNRYSVPSVRRMLAIAVFPSLFPLLSSSHGALCGALLFAAGRAQTAPTERHQRTDAVTTMCWAFNYYAEAAIFSLNLPFLINQPSLISCP